MHARVGACGSVVCACVCIVCVQFLFYIHDQGTLEGEISQVGGLVGMLMLVFRSCGYVDVSFH